MGFELHMCYNNKSVVKHNLLQGVRRESIFRAQDQNAKGLIYFLPLL